MAVEKPSDNALSRWKFFHIRRVWGTLGDVLATNLTLEEVLMGHLCAFIDDAPYPTDSGAIINPRGFIGVQIYGSSQPIDGNWPPLPGGARSDSEIADYLGKNGHNVSTDCYNAAIVLLETGAYKSARRQILDTMTPNFVFMITVLGDADVDGVYASAVKPSLEAHGLRVARADEIKRTDLIMNSVSEAIAASKFVVADLTNARPNSYYELGYAHALGKPGILIARESTIRHFDVAGYRWNHWRPGVDFRGEFEDAVRGVLAQIAGGKAWSERPSTLAR